MEGGIAGGGRGQRRAGPLKGRAEVVKVIAGRGSDVVVVHSSGGEAAVTVAESVRVKPGRAVRRGVAGSLLEESGRAERSRAVGVGPGATALGGSASQRLERDGPGRGPQDPSCGMQVAASAGPGLCRDAGPRWSSYCGKGQRYRSRLRQWWRGRRHGRRVGACKAGPSRAPRRCVGPSDEDAVGVGRDGYGLPGLGGVPRDEPGRVPPGHGRHGCDKKSCHSRIQQWSGGPPARSPSPYMQEPGRTAHRGVTWRRVARVPSESRRGRGAKNLVRKECR
jgi:hypothetical protein